MFKPTIITPPVAAATAAEAKAAQVFADSDSDTYINLMLSIAQAHIEGWRGWLGRAVGKQTIEVLVPACWEYDESCLLGPVISVTSDVPEADGRMRKLTYEAGFDPMPAPLKHAIILAAGALRDATPDDGGQIRKETVDGIGSREYQLPDGAADAMTNASDALLENYRLRT